MYGKNQVNINENDFDESYIKYHTNHNEVTVTYVCDLDGVLDGVSINNADLFLDAIHDIQLPFNDEFKSINDIYEETISDAIDLHGSIMREHDIESAQWKQHEQSFKGGKL